MDPALRFQARSIRVLKAKLATAEKDVVLFAGFKKSADQLGVDGFAYKTLLERASEQVRTLTDVIADVRRQK